MQGFISALTDTNGITSATLWGEITAAAGFIAAVVLFAFGYRIIRRLLNGASKGKAKI